MGAFVAIAILFNMTKPPAAEPKRAYHWFYLVQPRASRTMNQPVQGYWFQKKKSENLQKKKTLKKLKAKIEKLEEDTETRLKR